MLAKPVLLLYPLYRFFTTEADCLTALAALIAAVKHQSERLKQHSLCKKQRENVLGAVSK